jgi:hypothetical protein
VIITGKAKGHPEVYATIRSTAKSGKVPGDIGEGKAWRNFWRIPGVFFPRFASGDGY